MITIEEGNILDDKYTMICHQVNTLGIMGAGLAKQIKDKYPNVYIKYKSICNEVNHNYLMYNIGALPEMADNKIIRWVIL